MPTTDLPERLRLATRSLHARAERSGLMAELLRGRLTQPGYAALLRNLHPIYQALEAGLDRWQHDAAIGGMRHPALYRSAALAQDLCTWAGPHWPAAPLCPATRAYVQRLQALADTSHTQQPPRALLAHAYVRYLGDLHGGQVLSRLVSQVWPTQAAGLGQAFYDFGPPQAVLDWRQTLRQALAQAPLSEHEARQVVAEACWAFEQHSLLFDQLHSPPQQPEG